MGARDSARGRGEDRRKTVVVTALGRGRMMVAGKHVKGDFDGE